MVFGTITVDPATLDWVTLVSALLSLICLFCLRPGGPVEGYVVFGESSSKLRKAFSCILDYRVLACIIFVVIVASCSSYHV